ncbi:formyltetrahydrofolate deformylase [Marinibactrum halimedae]|uniref:Formyltetrahydrofolate deformylase n=1 Tax=Marinibactrum halimedae TaxID=1444977 RepID=A0AA37WN30_9GAMM|nr:formyltetrahydrofolate deformylase [Marinibactrum halimedae]MCD9458053.1 formyltetrahydrofolate deformylase [Marinibactrum halimedae]GLS27679.1 formyltetrahydrofolate deformylase [Marinibactrum halimedae]
MSKTQNTESTKVELENKDTGSSSTHEVVLKFSCSDQPGIVAAVANLFALQGFNIRESSQFEDVHTHKFFMRTVLESCEGPKSIEQVKTSFEPIAQRYGMEWSLYDNQYKPRVVIAVSQWGHCLENLLDGYKRGTLPIDIVAVVSNHAVMQPLCEWYQVPFHHLPVTKDTKSEQEAAILNIFSDNNADFLVLARYMQILSNDLCEALSGKAINIHHSFLPGFKGAKPYHQAYDRGVKLIGATAHYVTSELDEGPIIEQAVERVSHANTPEELVEIGRDIEAVVLNRAVRWHAQHRVLLNETKTVVFSR